MTTFTSEAQFEQALINELQNKGWDSQVLKNPTEADLLKNWAQTLFQNNLGSDRLNNVPLTDSEMQQIIEQIQDLRTPFKLNGFINGTAVAINSMAGRRQATFGRGGAVQHQSTDFPAETRLAQRSDTGRTRAHPKRAD